MTDEDTRDTQKNTRIVDLTGRVLRGEFRIEHPLGSGGMSDVWRAHQLGVERPCVVKVMTPPQGREEEYRARFMQEARAASSVQHPGIVTVYSFGEDPEVGPFIAMELVDGVSLHRLLARDGPLAEERAGRLVAQVCRALQEAHETGVIHRDLKPENVMIEDRRGREVARVLDFGIAKPRDSSVPTLDGLVLGTPHYMAPEQVRNQPLDPRADIYAAGIMLFELITGKVPFDASTPVALMLKHVQEPLPADALAAMSAGMRSVIERAAAKEPQDRHASAGDLADELERLVGPMSDVWSLEQVSEVSAVPRDTPALPPSTDSLDVPSPVAPVSGGEEAGRRTEMLPRPGATVGRGPSPLFFLAGGGGTVVLLIAVTAAWNLGRRGPEPAPEHPTIASASSAGPDVQATQDKAVWNAALGVREAYGRAVGAAEGHTLAPPSEGAPDAAAEPVPTRKHVPARPIEREDDDFDLVDPKRPAKPELKSPFGD